MLTLKFETCVETKNKTYCCGDGERLGALVAPGVRMWIAYAPTVIAGVQSVYKWSYAAVEQFSGSICQRISVIKPALGDRKAALNEVDECSESTDAPIRE